MTDEITLPALTIRTATSADLAPVTHLDARITAMAKPDFWRDMFERYTDRRGRHFLVAETEAAEGGLFLGFIAGEVRAWEFGSQPCGWIVAIGVNPDQRVQRKADRCEGRRRRGGGDASLYGESFDIS